MLSPKRIEQIPSHETTIHRALFGLIEAEVATDVEWLDVQNKIYNEVYYRKLWICGIPIRDRRYIAHHRMNSSNKGIGFSR